MIRVETEDVVTTAVGVESWKTRTMLIPPKIWITVVMPM